MKHTHCPNCKHADIEDFYTVKNAPVHSLVTIKDYEEAISVPRKDITLAFCNHCGFIFNSSFDTSLDYYTKGYEDQQGFSPTFVKFITGITKNSLTSMILKEKKLSRSVVGRETS